MVQNCANHIARVIKRLDTAVLLRGERHLSSRYPARTLTHSEMVLGRAPRIQNAFHLVPKRNDSRRGAAELALLERFDVQRMRQIRAIFQLIARHVCAVKPAFALPGLDYFRKTY